MKLKIWRWIVPVFVLLLVGATVWSGRPDLAIPLLMAAFLIIAIEFGAS